MVTTRCAQRPACVLPGGHSVSPVRESGAAAKGTTFESAEQAHKHSSVGTPLRRYTKSVLGQEECSKEGIFVPPVVFLPEPGLYLWTEATLGWPGSSSHRSRLSSASTITTFYHMLQHPLFPFLWAFLPRYREARQAEKKLLPLLVTELLS